jgi:YVTN family beta-propeller protein
MSHRRRLILVVVAAGLGIAVSVAWLGASAFAQTFAGAPTRVSTGTPRVIATIPVGASPTYPTANLLTQRIYIPNFLGNDISFISATHLVGTAQVGSHPNGAGVLPQSNRIYVSDSFDNAVTVIYSTTNQVEATIPVGQDPQGVAVDPGTDRIYVANELSDTVSVIDGTTNSVVDPVGVGVEPCSVAVNTATDRIYVTNSATNTVSVILDQ